MEFQARTFRQHRFEEQDIQSYRIKLGAKTLDLDYPLLLDEKIEISLSGQVVGVHHDVNQTTGELVRHHIIKIFDTNINTKETA